MKTFTFYSYKGGTGRSLLLANTARYLALLGHRVVAADFDFEAPGLHYKLNISPPGQRIADAIPERGAVDYLLALAREVPPRSLRPYVVSVPLPRNTKGTLHLMPAGAAPTGTYWKALTDLLRLDVFSDPEGSGIAACLEWKARVEEELKADFLLIDSRTGITELAGVTTTVLADKVICLMLANRESQMGARAVLRSLGHGARLTEQPPIEVVPVLSRVPDRDDSVAREALAFLNEKGPTPEDTLAFPKIFVLRSDPELGKAEKLHVGSGEAQNRSPLHQDYLTLLSELVEADPVRAAAIARRQEAIRDTREWLTDKPENRPHRQVAPDGFRAEQIDEGIEFKGSRYGSRDVRYADLVAYAGEDRTEALIAVEYVEDLKLFVSPKWWQEYTKLRCVVLVGKEDGKNTERRVFTRGRRGGDFTERDDFSGWAVRWPISFSSLDDPGDRSATSLLAAVQRGEDGFVNLLVGEWQHSSFVTLHGGAPYRPRLARQILDGLAQVSNVETELRILWRTAPEHLERGHDGFLPTRGPSMDELTTLELHAPLWWRLSVEAKAKYWSGHEACYAGIELLACTLMGLAYDPDRDFRKEMGQIVGSFDESDHSDQGVYPFIDFFRGRELRFRLSDETSPELVRREALRSRLEGRTADREHKDPWLAAEHDAERTLSDDRALAAILRVPESRVSVPTSDLLAHYDPASAQVTLYSKVIDGCSRLLGIERRALANVVFIHETAHALCHLGRDLDGRRWEEFALPSSRGLSFRPSALHETIAQFFTHRLITRLEDSALLSAFERLSDHQPPEYQTWRKMTDVPVETVRKLLIRARAGLDDTPWGVGPD